MRNEGRLMQILGKRDAREGQLLSLSRSPRSLPADVPDIDVIVVLGLGLCGKDINCAVHVISLTLHRTDRVSMCQAYMFMTRADFQKKKRPKTRLMVHPEAAAADIICLDDRSAASS